DAALSGPGMRRDVATRFNDDNISQATPQTLTPTEWEEDTLAVTAALLQAFSQLTWVIDAGALQVMPQSILPDKAILTPHHGEFLDLLKRWESDIQHEVKSQVMELRQQIDEQFPRVHSSDAVRCIRVDSAHPSAQLLQQLCQKWGDATLVLK